MMISNRYRLDSTMIATAAADRRRASRVWQALTWAMAGFERATQRRRLMALSERAMADLALSRADAEGEAAKPFWRA